MKIYLYLLITFLLLPFLSFSQGIGNYKSVSTGSWTSLSTWNVWNGTAWVAPNEYPSSSNSTKITIDKNTTVSLVSPNNILADQLVVSNTATLIIDEGAKLTITNGTGDDLFIAEKSRVGGMEGRMIVRGTLVAQNGVKILSSTITLSFESSGVYEHAFTTENGTIPTAQWSIGSTVLISSYTTNTQAPLGINQGLFNIVWKTPALSANAYIDLAGTLTDVKGSLIFEDTGSNSVSISDFTDFTLTVGKDFIIRDKASVYFSYNQVTAVIVVTGNLEIRTEKPVSFTEESNLIIEVGGDLIFDGIGVYDLVSALFGIGNGTSNISVLGNTQFLNGTIQKSGAGTARLVLENVNVVSQVNSSTTISNVDLLVSGNWTNNGGVFFGTTSTFTFNGQTQSIQSSNQPFGTIFINTFSSTVTALDDMSVAHNFNLANSATFNLATNQITLSVAGNWNNTDGIFQHNGGTVLLNGGEQTISTANQSFGNLIFAGSGNKQLIGDILDVDGNLIINANSGLAAGVNNTIYVGGNWQNSGSFNAGAGKIIFDGSGLQTISGSTITEFNVIEIGNATASSSVRVDSDQHLRGTLDLRNISSFDPDGSDGTVNFTLLSSAGNTASIAPLVNGAAVTGNVVVQRYLNPTGQVFRYVATPVTNATVADWADDVQINIAGTTAIDNLYYYNEAELGLVDIGWTPYPSAYTDPLHVGLGYSLGMFDGNNAKILQIKGPVHQGPISMPVSFTNSAEDTNLNDGWNLLGNPYPSAIDWLKIWNHSLTANIDPTIWITNSANGDDVYASYNATVGDGLNGGSKDIASGQSFWVQTTAPNPQLTITEQHKSAANNTMFFKLKAPEDILVVGLKKGNVLDETAIIFRDDAKAGYEPLRDTYKLKNYMHSLSSLGDGEEDLAYNFLPWFSCSTDTRLFVDNTEAGEYTFVFRNLNTFNRAIGFTLIDRLKGLEVAVQENTSYTFDITDDPASSGKERFLIRASYKELQTNLAVSANATCTGQEASVLIENAENQVGYQAFINGNAVSEIVKGENNMLTLKIPASALGAGNQQLEIKASREGCMTATLTQKAQLNIYPVNEITKVQGGTSCTSGTVTLTAEGAAADGSYRWYSSATDQEPIEGATEATFITPVLEETTAYFVTVMNANDCESNTRTKVVAKIGVGEIPVVTLNDNKLTASGTGSFQWYLNGQAIQNATQQSIIPTKSGIYTVSLQSAEGCSQISEEFTYEALGVEKLLQPSFKIWPNPSSDFLYLQHESKASSSYTIRIISLDGKIIYTENATTALNKVHKLDIRILKSGVYIIELQNNDETVRSRIIRR